MKRKIAKSLRGMVLIALMLSLHISFASAQSNKHFKPRSSPAIGETITSFNVHIGDKKFEVKILQLSDASEEQCVAYLKEHDGLILGNDLKQFLHPMPIIGQVFMFSEQNVEHPRHAWIPVAVFGDTEISFSEIASSGLLSYNASYLLLVTAEKAN